MSSYLSDFEHTKLNTHVYPGGVAVETVFVSDPSTGLRRVPKTKVWKVERALGRGGYGEVRLEICVDENEKRAVKRIWTNGSTLKKEYERELKALLEFSKPKYKEAAVFVEFLGWFEDLESVYLAMEYVALGDLEDNVPAKPGAIREPEIRDITFQILEGLKIMHQEAFVHRDLKPKNVLVCRGSPQWWIKLADFGLSKRRTEHTAYYTHTGTQSYMAPEVLNYVPGIDPETSEYTNAIDLWALGCIVYRLASGTVPFPQGPSLLKFCENPELGFPQGRLYLSTHGLNFIKGLLEPLPSARLTAQQALDHNWMSINLLEALDGNLKFGSESSITASSFANYNTKTHAGLRSKELSAGMLQPSSHVDLENNDTGIVPDASHGSRPVAEVAIDSSSQDRHSQFGQISKAAMKRAQRETGGTGDDKRRSDEEIGGTVMHVTLNAENKTGIQAQWEPLEPHAHGEGSTPFHKHTNASDTNSLNNPGSDNKSEAVKQKMLIDTQQKAAEQLLQQAVGNRENILEKVNVEQPNLEVERSLFGHQSRQQKIDVQRDSPQQVAAIVKLPSKSQLPMASPSPFLSPTAEKGPVASKGQPEKTPSRWADLFKPSEDRTPLQFASPRLSPKATSTTKGISPNVANPKASSSLGTPQAVPSIPKPANSARSLIPHDDNTPAQRNKYTPPASRKLPKKEKKGKRSLPPIANASPTLENNTNLNPSHLNPAISEFPAGPSRLVQNNSKSPDEKKEKILDQGPQLSKETATVERDVAAAFKSFVAQQRKNAEAARSSKARRDKEIKLEDLKKFANTFTLTTPVPSDLVSLLAKDPTKQMEIQRKALEESHKSGGFTPTSGTLSPKK